MRRTESMRMVAREQLGVRYSAVADADLVARADGGAQREGDRLAVVVERDAATRAARVIEAV